MYLIKLILRMLCSIRDRMLFGKTTVGLEAPVPLQCKLCHVALDHPEHWHMERPVCAQCAEELEADHETIES